MLWFFAATAVAAPPSVYHSTADDGVDPGGSVLIPPVQTTVHLYLDGGATASSADPCSVGDGDEVCGWRLHLEGQSGLDLISFTPTGDVVFALTGNTLRSTGGSPSTGTLGPTKIGDLVVEGIEGGLLALADADSVSASQTLEAITPTTLVVIPEPAALATLSSGVALLLLLERRRSQRGIRSS